MFDWMPKRRPKPQIDVAAEAAKKNGRNKTGKYRLLYEYLENRYANAVVLTFGQIEDLLGFTLPELAHTEATWWTATDAAATEARCSDAWTMAGRTAKPNLSAHTVLFERVS